MNKPLITIGMAHYNDWDGVYFTLQAIAMAHRASGILDDCEVVVVDNSPHLQEQRKAINNLLGNLNHVFGGTKYVEHTSPTGTSPSRDRVFAEASGDYVLCMDCHVLLDPGFLPRLHELAKVTWHDPVRDILSGPLVFDNHTGLATHFHPEWRGHMYGTWAQAWYGREGMPDFVLRPTSDGKAQPHNLMTGKPLSGDGWPVVGWAGHESHWIKAGYTPVSSVHSPFIEIPGQGLGVFVAHRETWPGFHPDARGFGGEELYIHEKYRQMGHKALCVPWMRWLHRFARIGGVPYPLDLASRVRNYVLEFNELGKPLDEIHTHFVKSGGMKPDVWEALVADPVNFNQKTEQPHIVAGGKSGSGCSTCDTAATSIEQEYDTLHNTRRDLNEHMPVLREYASRGESAAEWSYRRESSIAILSSGVRRFISWNPENNAVRANPDLVGNLKHTYAATDPANVTELAEDVDMVFLDIKHTYDAYSTLLGSLSPRVKKYIAVHDTHIYGEKGEDGGRGVLVALRDFMRQNPEWSVVYHTNNQYGLTILSRLPEDKPKPPGMVTKVANFAKAAKTHVATGAKKAAQDVYEHRLNVCATCPKRADDVCSVCGCFIATKASWKESECPIGLWESTPQADTTTEGDSSNEGDA